MPTIAFPPEMPLTDQFRDESKLPVPETVPEHWVVWPVGTADRVQETLTDVIVGVGDEGAVELLPPLPQPVMQKDALTRKVSHIFAQSSIQTFLARNRFAIMLLPTPSPVITVLQGAALRSRGEPASVPS